LCCCFLFLIGFNVFLLSFQALIICRGALSLLKQKLSWGILFFKQDASCNTLVYIGCICILMLELYATCWRNLCRVWKINLWLCCAHVFNDIRKTLFFAMLFFCIICASVDLLLPSYFALICFFLGTFTWWPCKCWGKCWFSKTEPCCYFC